MDKIKIELPKIIEKEVEFCGEKIKIENQISADKYEKIIDDIKTNILLNAEVEDKAALSDMRFIQLVLTLCTNIDVDSLDIDNFINPLLINFLKENIENYSIIEKYIKSEYDRWVIENCFGVLTTKMPTQKEIEKSMKKITETIDKIPSEKLEMLAKSIVWNKSPIVGNAVAPATHIEAE